ncbi:hypothetical protein K488DRAFT_63073 [Vararia minispora EC-137]|uniref:Uncharacterized protein n=1 Tax=Vararia minispora EC-137 TaxID=1314806 RepID=A0ACB8Q619_9AGAM|nr:hypothetical protein K488DRAFT_63073 [Vararia minispora EC-137]
MPKSYLSHASPASNTAITSPAGRGPMIPQKPYRPHGIMVRYHVREAQLEPPIFFSSLRPELDGFALSDALAGRFSSLVNGSDHVFRDRGPSIALRLQWPGYPSWSRQIPTRDFRSPAGGPVTRAKLAKNIAKSVSRFIAEHASRPMEQDADPAWRVGGEGIQLSDLALIRLDHVSKGSWQVQLCLLEPPKGLAATELGSALVSSRTTGTSSSLVLAMQPSSD